MEYYIVAGIILAVILFILFLIKFRKSRYRYQARESFFSRNELKFYKELKKSAPAFHYVIFSKVRLADIIEPKKHDSTWQAHFNKICSKHVDFVLFDEKINAPKLVIELDDRSHDRADRQKRDFFVDKAFHQSGIPILHTRSSDRLKEQIQKALS